MRSGSHVQFTEGEAPDASRTKTSTDASRAIRAMPKSPGYWAIQLESVPNIAWFRLKLVIAWQPDPGERLLHIGQEGSRKKGQRVFCRTLPPSVAIFPKLRTCGEPEAIGDQRV